MCCLTNLSNQRSPRLCSISQSSSSRAEFLRMRLGDEIRQFNKPHVYFRVKLTMSHGNFRVSCVSFFRHPNRQRVLHIEPVHVYRETRLFSDLIVSSSVHV